MTVLPASLAQSTWGEKCSFYLDSYIIHTLKNNIHIPVALHTLHHRLVHSLRSLVAEPPGIIINGGTGTTNKSTLALLAASTTLIAAAVIIIVFAMSSWRSPFGSFWRRSSPNYSPVSPHVRNGDYSYMTSGDIAEDLQQQQQQQLRGPSDDDDDDTKPDILFLKHQGYRYTLSFPAYAIGDGELTVGELRRAAMDTTSARELGCIKLLYKGKVLNDDRRSCKAEGLKQESEVFCVVSQLNFDELSEESERMRQRVPDSGEEERSARSGGKKNNKKNNKKKNNRKSSPQPVEDHVEHPQRGHMPPPPPQQYAHYPPPPPQQYYYQPSPQSSQQYHYQLPPQPQPPQMQPPPRQPPQQPTLQRQLPQRQPAPQHYPPPPQPPPSKDQKAAISTSPSNLPDPAPDLKKFNNAMEQVKGLTAYYRTKLVPGSEAFLNNTPSDPKLRDFEHKMYTETIMAQVVLKADEIQPEGNPEIRKARKDLLNEAQAMMTKLDQAFNVS